MTSEEFREKFTLGLNDQQKEAIFKINGSKRLLAVPGSGKTTVLVKRIGYMIFCCNIDPENILTMTYTKPAAEDMKQRFINVFGRKYADKIRFATINSFSKEVIEYYAENYSENEPYSLIKDDDNKKTQIISQVYQNISNEFPTDNLLLNISTGISYIKNMMLKTVDEIKKVDVGVENIDIIYDRYCKILKSENLMDFDDQLRYALKFLIAVPGVLSYFQDKYRYICVDESQDTSKIQHEIIKVLSQKHGNIFMVGDEDQSIYGFRAAYPDALKEFSQSYNEAEILMMETNYRSTNEILYAANSFVSKNRFRYKKNIKPYRGSGDPVQKINVADRVTQFKYLLEIARDCKDDTAVLYRNNDSAIPMIDMLERNGILYNINTKKQNGFSGFFSHSVVVDVIDIIKFSYDPYNAEIFMRIYYKFCIYIKQESALYACEQSRKTGKTILDELACAPGITLSTKERIIDILINLSEVQKKNAEGALDHIRSFLNYDKYTKEKNLDSGKLKILYMLAKNEITPESFINRLDELKNIIKYHNNRETVKFMLSTIHSSKGLEYKVVYLLDVLNGILPMISETDCKTDERINLYEEERRLYYVAMTRAKDTLNLFNCDGIKSDFNDEIFSVLPKEVIDETDIFSFIKENLLYKKYTDKNNGKGTIIAQRDDDFLIEYSNGNLKLLNAEQMFKNRNRTVIYQEANLENDNYEKSAGMSGDISFSCGCNVFHKSFGHGVVLSVKDDIIEIHFETIDMVKSLSINTCLEKGLLK